MATRSLGTLTIDLIARTFGFDQGMDKAARNFDKRLQQIEKRAKQFGQVLGVGIAAGVAAASAALVKVTTDAIEYADQLDELSARLGISTEQLSAWGYAAKLSGTDLESLASAIPKLSKNLAAALDTGSKQAELFDALGVSVTDASGKLRDVEDVLPEIATKFRSLDDDTAEAALAMELFGKSGAELLEFLNRGGQGLDDLAKRAQALGIIVGQDTAEAAGQFKDRLGDLEAVALSLGVQLAERLLPYADSLVESFSDLVREGGAVEKIMAAVDATIDTVSTTFSQFNHLIQTTTDFFGGLYEIISADLELLRDFATFDWEGVGRALDRGMGGVDRFKRSFQTFEEFQANKNRKQPGEVPTYLDVPSYLTGEAPFNAVGFNATAPVSRGSTADAKRVNDYLAANPDDPSKDPVKRTKELTAAQKAFNEQEEDFAAIAEMTEEYRRQQIEDAYSLEQARERGIAQVDKQIEDMEFEQKLLGLTNRERAREVELRYAGADATEEQRAKIVDLAEASYDANRAIGIQTEAMDGLRDAGKGFLEDLSSGVGIFGSLENAVDRLEAKLLDLVEQNLIDQLFGQSGDTGGGSFGSTFASIFGSFFGGGKASGGTARPNSLYEVNERGIEMARVRGRDYMLTGDSPVEITPNSALGGGGLNVTQNIYNPNYTDPRSRSQLLQDSAQQLRIAAARNS